jgi:hypothetical protein
MPAVIMCQDNLSCMVLLARGRSGGELTRHIDIRYFWMKDRVELYANVLTKPLQGSQFVSERGCQTGWPATEEKESKPVERAVESGKGARTVGFLV